MSFKPPTGWQTETEKLFIHNSGVRLQLMSYRGEEGWYLVPAELDQAVMKFDATNDGRDKAFAAFTAGVLEQEKAKPKPASKAKSKGPKRKPIVVPEEGEEPEEPGPEPAEPVEEKEEAGDEDDEEEEEEEEGGED